MRIKNDFHIKGWAPTLVLTQRPRGTRKWPINGRVAMRVSNYVIYANLLVCFETQFWSQRFMFCLERYTGRMIYCAFQKHANYEIQKPTDGYVFSLPSIILADPLENKTLLQRVQKVMYGICHWWISICFGCFCVSRLVACDRNYDWRQRKTQLWRRLLNFRVRMFVKSAVINSLFSFI